MCGLFTVPRCPEIYINYPETVIANSCLDNGIEKKATNQRNLKKKLPSLNNVILPNLVTYTSIPFDIQGFSYISYLRVSKIFRT